MPGAMDQNESGQASSPEEMQDAWCKKRKTEMLEQPAARIQILASGAKAPTIRRRLVAGLKPRPSVALARAPRLKALQSPGPTVARLKPRPDEKQVPRSG